MLSDCFDTLEVYGKDHTQFPVTVKMFVMTLERFELRHIDRAFREWVDGNDKAPKPNHIKDLCESYVADEQKKIKERKYMEDLKERRKPRPEPSDLEKLAVSKLVQQAKRNLSGAKETTS